MIITETKRLFLRHFHIFDSKAMNRVFGDPEVMRFGDGVQTERWVGDWLQNCLKNYYQNWGFGPWAVVEKTTQEVIGYCGLFHFPDVGGRPEVEIGCRLARSFWGHGYATEAVIAVRDYAFNTLGLQRVICIIDPNNISSIRMAEKAGMTYDNQDFMMEGYTHPDRVYSIGRTSIG